MMKYLLALSLALGIGCATFAQDEETAEAVVEIEAAADAAVGSPAGTDSETVAVSENESPADDAVTSNDVEDLEDVDIGIETETDDTPVDGASEEGVEEAVVEEEPAAENEIAEDSQTEQKQAETRPMVTLKTSQGDITIELYPDKAPDTVANFLQYVADGFYNGTVFHRVIDGFMIQGGGFTEQMQQKQTRRPVKNEAANGLKNERGTLAMARTGDPHSATAQFFINVKDNDFLNYTSSDPRGFGYCVFGKVISGMDTVDKIKGVRTSTQGFFENVPVDPVVIIEATENAK